MSKRAIDGGTPVFTGQFPTWPQWGKKEEEALVATLHAGQWGTLGERVMNFSARFANYVGAKHCICMNTGTQALELVLRGAGIGWGDEVIVPSYTFVATVSAVAMTGALPVFVDVDLDTGCLDAASVDQAVTDKTRAVLAVHIAGRPCDMDTLNAVCAKRGLRLFEDASHAHGSEWRGAKTGSLADGAAFSCQSSKLLTAGEGGLMTTSDDALHAECWHYHNSGRALEGSAELGGRVLMGTNGRMAEWQAAILDAQLDRLDEQNALRAANAMRLTSALSQISGMILPKPDERVTRNGHYLFPMRIDETKLRMDRDSFVSAVRAEGIPILAGYTPLHTSEMLRSAEFKLATGASDGRAVRPLPNTEHLCKTAVWIPGNVLLADVADIGKVAEAVEKVVVNTGGQ